jgi:hypothetical protein
MNGKKLVVYLVIPLALSSLLLAMYFSGNIVLQRLVSPKLLPLPLDSWREFGLLETIQNLLLLIITGVSIAGILRKQDLRERIALALIAAASVFVFFEEIDYGTHYVAYAQSETSFRWFAPLSELAAEMAQLPPAEDPFNLHNQDLPVVGELTDIFKAAAILILVGWFFLLPLAAGKLSNPWLRYLAPDRYVLLTLGVMMLISFAAHELGEAHDAAFKAAVARGETPTMELGSIQKNLSEFRELNIYYIFLVYLGNLVFFRQRAV